MVCSLSRGVLPSQSAPQLDDMLVIERLKPCFAAEKLNNLHHSCCAVLVPYINALSLPLHPHQLRCVGCSTFYRLFNRIYRNIINKNEVKERDRWLMAPAVRAVVAAVCRWLVGAGAGKLEVTQPFPTV